MIPLIDLTFEPELYKEIKKRVNNVIDSKSYILGSELEKFEKEFAKHTGVKEAIGVASGTDALKLALRANGIGRNDKVITVSLTSPFTSVAIMEEGATPVYCDVDEDTWTMDPKACESLIDKNVKAIMPVHIYGNPANMRAILNVAKRHNLKVIEDACQAHGATINNKGAGNYSDAAAFSFYPTKNLGGFGDGGIVVTNNKKTAKLLKLLRHGGQTKRFWHVHRGTNSRLDEMQAAILSAKIKWLKRHNSARIRLARNYIRALKGLPISFQKTADGGSSVYHLFVIRTDRRKQLHSFLLKNGVFTDIYYPNPVHKQPIFQQYAKNKLPITDMLSEQLLALPLYPSMKEKDQSYVISMIQKFYGEK